MKYKFIILFVLLSMRINAQFTLLSSLVYGGYESLPASYNYDGVCPSGGTRFTDYDCATEDFSNATNVALLDTNDFTEVIYINPDWGGAQNGTYLEPYDSWNDISTYITNYAYVQKRGTTCEITTEIDFSIDNVLWGAYGEGERPIISKTTDAGLMVDLFQTFTFRDLHFQDNGALEATGISIFAHGGCDESFVYNCEFTNAMSAFYTYASDVRIINCEFHNMARDAIWMADADYIEVAHCNIYEINRNYFIDKSESFAGGDGLQFEEGWSQAWIHHNIIDKSDDGNKACLMLTNAGSTRYDELCIVEQNTIKGPLHDTDGSTGSSVNLSNSKNFLVLRNHFIGYAGTESKGVGIGNYSTTDSIWGNVFENFYIAIEGSGANAVISNNTFYGNDTITNNVDGTYYNNILSVDSGDASFIGGNVDAEDQNLFTGTIHGSFPNSFQGNPLYTDSLNSDFSLRIGSDAIDSAVVLPYYEYDITKKEITGTPDCGAYEH